jgi:opacity protein-like surface antigen
VDRYTGWRTIWAEVDIREKPASGGVFMGSSLINADAILVPNDSCPIFGIPRQEVHVLRRLMSNGIVLVAVFALVCPAFAQVEVERESTGEVFGGGSYVRTDDNPNVNAYGWEASYSQYPYESLGWFGGTIEANGVYASPSIRIGNQTIGGLLNDKIYTFMGGPTFARHTHRAVTPFAHALLGAVLTSVNTTGKGQNVLGSSVSVSQTAFGYALGGGIDVPFTSKLAVRGQADWLRSTFKDSNVDRQNNLRLLLGIVLKF